MRRESAPEGVISRSNLSSNHGLGLIYRLAPACPWANIESPGTRAFRATSERAPRRFELAFAVKERVPMFIARVELPTVLLLLFSVVTCAEHPAGEAKASNDAASSPEHDPVGATPAKAPEGDSSGAGESCGDVACQSNSDCCKGYSCGFDPERSRVQRYCLGP